jgi:hypothetical protein
MKDRLSALSNDAHEIPRLLGDAVEQLGKLMQNEAQLAKAELSQKIALAGTGAGYIGAAAVFSIPVLVLLLLALAWWLVDQGFSPATAHLIAAGGGAIICIILATIGLSYLKPRRLTPKVTIEQLQRDAATAKELTR